MSWEHFCSLYGVKKKYLSANHLELKIPPDSEGSFQKKAEVWLKSPCSLILEGPPGRGKTHFMFALIRGILSQKHISQIRFIRSKDLDDKLSTEFNLYGTCKHVLETFSETEYLFLDDFGVQRMTEKAERDYFDLIDNRISDEKVTVFSTNLNSEDIHKCFGARIHSRLRECRKIIFRGK